jgi:hypothetical protein
MGTGFIPRREIAHGRAKLKWLTKSAGRIFLRVSPPALQPRETDRQRLGLRTASVAFGVRGPRSACVGRWIRGAWLRGLLRQGFKLVDEVGISRGIEILKLRGEAIDLLDLYFA